MSYFSTALKHHSERRHLSQTDLAKAAGLSKSFISRLLTGESRDLSDHNFLSILKAFTPDHIAQAELVKARCMDAKAPAAGIPGADLVEITIDRGQAPTSPTPNPPLIQLSAQTEKAFAWLRSQCPLNPDLEKHLIGYAKLTGMK